MSDKKTIVSLGLSGSGKTNYIAASLVYMVECCMGHEGSGNWNYSRFKDWKIKQRNAGISILIDKFEDCLKQGLWYDKTEYGTWDEFDFDLPSHLSLFPPRIDLAKSVTVRDWAGDSFKALAGAQSEEDEDQLVTFKKHCRIAKGFILCLDGRSMLDDREKRKVQDSLRKFCELVGWLTADKESENESRSEETGTSSTIQRNFAIVVTMSDYLIGLDDFCEQVPHAIDLELLKRLGLESQSLTDSIISKLNQETGMINLDKLNKKIRESYRSFFGILQSQHCRVGIFPVSLVPFKQFRRDDPEYGRMPVGKNWELNKVMESSLINRASILKYGERYYDNMYGAFLWLLENI